MTDQSNDEAPMNVIEYTSKQVASILADSSSDIPPGEYTARLEIVTTARGEIEKVLLLWRRGHE